MLMSCAYAYIGFRRRKAWFIIGICICCVYSNRVNLEWISTAFILIFSIIHKVQTILELHGAWRREDISSLLALALNKQ